MRLRFLEFVVSLIVVIATARLLLASDAPNFCCRLNRCCVKKKKADHLATDNNESAITGEDLAL
jgi:hypothetical protein